MKAAEYFTQSSLLTKVIEALAFLHMERRGCAKWDGEWVSVSSGTGSPG